MFQVLLRISKKSLAAGKISGVWSLGLKQNSHVKPIFYPITSMVEIYLSEAYGHAKNSKSNKMFRS